MGSNTSNRERLRMIISNLHSSYQICLIVLSSRNIRIKPWVLRNRNKFNWISNMYSICKVNKTNLRIWPKIKINTNNNNLNNNNNRRNRKIWLGVLRMTFMMKICLIWLIIWNKKSNNRKLIIVSILIIHIVYLIENLI